jgi:hypothetical protein
VLAELPAPDPAAKLQVLLNINKTLHNKVVNRMLE